MQLSVKGKQLDVGDSLRAHIQSQLTELVGKYFSSPIEAQVTLSKDAHLFRADISVHAGRGIQLQSTSSAADPYAAFDEAATRIAGRLRRYKKKLVDHHKQQRSEEQAVIANAFVLNAVHSDDAEGHAADHPVVVAEMTTPIESLTVGEAVMRLDLGDLPALMFRNRANGGLNMIYRRADGHIGWVDPAQTVAANKPHATAKTATS